MEKPLVKIAPKFTDFNRYYFIKGSSFVFKKIQISGFLYVNNHIRYFENGSLSPIIEEANIYLTKQELLSAITVEFEEIKKMFKEQLEEL